MYYKLKIGYGLEEYIQITRDELEKATYCFLTKKDSVYSGGACKGSEILAIQPDFHRVMNWNRGWKLTGDDYDELRQKGIDRKMNKELEDTKIKIQYLIETRQENLIGKNIQTPELEKTKELPDDLKRLSESVINKFKI
jgi:hypothetical protein